MSGLFARLARSSSVHAAVAFAAMGGWAVLANSAHEMPEPLLAGLIQGTLSALTTLFLKTAIEQLVIRLSGLAALLLPPLAAGLSSAAILTGSHALGGTPEVLGTVALPLAVATLYSVIWTHALWSHRRVSRP